MKLFFIDGELITCQVLLQIKFEHDPNLMALFGILVPIYSIFSWSLFEFFHLFLVMMSKQIM